MPPDLERSEKQPCFNLLNRACTAELHGARQLIVEDGNRPVGARLTTRYRPIQRGTAQQNTIDPTEQGFASALQ